MGSPDGVKKFFISKHWERLVNIYHDGNISFRARMMSRLPGSLKQTWGSGCLSWQPNDSIWFRLGRILWPWIHLNFISFNAVEFLQSENTFVMTVALRYGKHLSTSVTAVGDMIIGKSLDKFVKVRDVKVSTKRWCGSQTQQYSGSGTG